MASAVMPTGYDHREVTRPFELRDEPARDLIVGKRALPGADATRPCRGSGC
jgi:hypothetical protein